MKADNILTPHSTLWNNLEKLEKEKITKGRLLSFLQNRKRFSQMKH